MAALHSHMLAHLIAKLEGLSHPKIVPCVPLLHMHNLITHMDVIK